MPNVLSRSVVLALALIATGGARVRGQDRVDVGEAGSSIFRTYCAACHGVDAKGDGPLADGLRTRPPDLTLLAKRNGGNYPDEKVHRIIDGRKPVKGHGGADMPIWGDAFRSSHEGYSEEKVKERIGLVVEYLKTIQVTTK
jgi:mono/diheme cytochrome c family protein